MNEFIPNPGLYRQLNVPFETIDLANMALSAFLADMQAAREKHRIANLLVTASLTILDEHGEEFGVTAYGGFGDPNQFEGMAAYTLGVESAEREKRIGKVLRQGIKQPGNK